MSESANAMIPLEIRNQFPQDDDGRVLFFTTPPIDTRHVLDGRSRAEKGIPLRHSEAFLAARKARAQQIKERRAQRDAESGSGRHKSRPEVEDSSWMLQKSHLKREALLSVARQLDQRTDEFYRRQYGSSWREYKGADSAKHRIMAEEQENHVKSKAEQMKRMYITPGSVPIFSGSIMPGNELLFKDDFDARY